MNITEGQHYEKCYLYLWDTDEIGIVYGTTEIKRNLYLDVDLAEYKQSKKQDLLIVWPVEGASRHHNNQVPCEFNCVLCIQMNNFNNKSMNYKTITVIINLP